MFLQAWLLGISDVASLILMFIATYIMFHSVITVQTGHKRALRAHARVNSRLYSFLSDKNTIGLIIISFFLSAFLSLLLTVTLKGIILNNGYIALGVIILTSSFALTRFFNLTETTSAVVNDNLQADVANHANNLLQFFIISLFLTFILALFLSYGDTNEILNKNIRIENFVQTAASEQIEKTEYNHISRLLVNLHILVDNFKLAASSLIVQTLFSSPKDNFLTLYWIVFLLNFLKLIGFSFSIILMQRGLEMFAKKTINGKHKVLHRETNNISKGDDTSA